MAPRIHEMASGINAADPPIDVLVLLEANRPSKGISFTRLAAAIEDETGLLYLGCKTMNATANCFDKAFFVRPSRAFVAAATQRWTDPSNHIVAGPHFGCDVLFLTIHPVDSETKQVVRNRWFEAGFVYFPMGREDRLTTARWVASHGYPFVDGWMGDWNTFPDDGGPEMIEIISEAYKPVSDPAQITFQAFPHDLITKPASIRETLNPESTIVSENADGTVNVRFASLLDHVFVRPDAAFEESVKVYPLFEASDHALVVLKVVL